MKRIVLLLAMSLIVIVINAQSSVDRLFEKYAGTGGFVTVTVNGNLLKMIAEMDEDDDELMKYADKFTSIRILAQEDETLRVENFYDSVIDELDRGGYEELMDVNSTDSDLKILVKSEGRVFREFILIAGGEDNALIQIKGNLTASDIKEMEKSVKVDNKTNLFNLR